MKKAIKKIVAVATGALMVGTTIFGAHAAALENFPEPFVTGGVADVQFVVGAGSTDDYLGLIDIATSLQADSVTESSVSVGSTVETTVAGGAKLESIGETLSFRSTDTSVAVKDKFQKEDLPELLADGQVNDENVEKTDYDYSQEIVPGAIVMAFDNPKDEIYDMPVMNYDLGTAEAYQAIVDFSDNLNVMATAVAGTGLDNSETINMFGKDFTFKVDMLTGSDLVMYGSDTTTYLELNTPKTISVEGTSYTIEIVGANSEANSGETIILDVNGVRKTVTESDTTTINGLEVFVKDLFVTNIPTLSASANIFVGSQEIKIPSSAYDTTCTANWKALKVNGETLKGVKVCLKGTETALEEMQFQVKPGDADPKVKWLAEGDSFVDPMFGTFELRYEGPSIPLMAETRDFLAIEKEGSSYVAKFTNKDGDSYDFEFVQESGATLILADNLGSSTTNPVFAADASIDEDSIFIVSEGSGKNEVTKIYQVEEIDGDENEVTFADLSDGSIITVKGGDQLEDTGYFVADDASATDVTLASGATDFEFSFNATAGVAAGVATLDYIVSQNDLWVKLETIATNEMNISFSEDHNGEMAEEGIVGEDLNASIGLTSGELDFTTGLILNGTGENSLTMVADEDSEVEYGVTELGTYIAEEVDDEADYIRFYIPDELVSYNVFVAPTGAAVSSAGGDGTVTTQSVNRIAVGAAVRDVDVNIANPAHNLVVIGGTCINSIAASLKEVAAGTCGTESGLNPNEAIIELFDLDNGKVAMLVAGWEATETQAAARAVATKAAGLTGTSAKLTVTSVSDYTIQ